MLNETLIKITTNKLGVEIGGSSAIATTIYKNANSIDNVIFSKNTIWSNYTDEYNYYDNKRGKIIVNDAVNIYSVKDETYDFCFSSHVL